MVDELITIVDARPIASWRGLRRLRNIYHLMRPEPITRYPFDPRLAARYR
jgi:hypothetical protein